MDFTRLFSDKAARMKASQIRELLKLTENPEIISFAGGLPNPGTFPTEAIEESTHRVLRDHAAAACQYSTTEGVASLRQEIATHLQADGMDVTPDMVTITNGSQQGLDLLGRVFINPDDVVLTSNPTYLGAIQAFDYYGCDYAAASSDKDGIIPDSLEETITATEKAGKTSKFLYLVPTFQNPSGTVITESRRKRILDLAHEHDILIIEDDPYGKLRFDGDPVPTMHSMDNEDRVVYFGTFSKILVPGFRLAWSVAPMDITRKMVISKQSVDLCTNAFTQHIAADLMANGIIDGHLPEIISMYRRKRDIMLNTMDEVFPDDVNYTRSQGGLFTWAELPEHVNTVDMMPACVAEGKVAYVPGQSFYAGGGGHNTMRLNFSHPADDKVEEGIRRLAPIMEKWINRERLPA